jgi:hypothetical protein
MAVQALAQMPAAFTAGDSLSLLISLADFPASEGWTITYSLIITGAATVLTLGPSTAAGNAHALAAAPSVTDDWAAGTYQWQLKASKGTGPSLEVHTAATGSIEIRAALATGVDPRTHKEKCLAAITAVLEGRIGDPITEYRIGDREAKRIPHFDLVKLQAHYETAVRRERGESLMRPIPVRFESGRFRI